MDQAAADPSVNRATLVIVNGAQGGRDAQSWTKAGNNVYDVVRDERLRPLGVTEKHVQVVWLKQANAGPKISLPDTSADTYQLERSLGEIVRAPDWVSIGQNASTCSRMHSIEARQVLPQTLGVPGSECPVVSCASDVSRSSSPTSGAAFFTASTASSAATSICCPVPRVLRSAYMGRPRPRANVAPPCDLAHGEETGRALPACLARQQ
ncbi:hypothetical protein BH23GEM5_BH23GEM5_09930 [soil metagenome]